MQDSYSFISKSPAETISFAKRIAKLIKAPSVILLKGELGTGKTLLTKAAAKALGYQGEVTSPTFKLVQEYQGRPEIIHMDLYRLEQTEELLEIGFEDYLKREAIIFIEWPEIAFPLLSADFIFIKIEKINTNQRKIVIAGEGKETKVLIERLNQEC